MAEQFKCVNEEMLANRKAVLDVKDLAARLAGVEATLADIVKRVSAIEKKLG